VLLVSPEISGLRAHLIGMEVCYGLARIGYKSKKALELPQTS